MTNFNEYLSQNNTLFTGRASTAIYLILKANNIHNKHIIVPANICYAAIFPIIFSGNIPFFVDVGKDGNVDLNIIKSSYRTDIAAAIVPHMYGNPCLDIMDISGFLRKKSVLMIEDCASCMGATVPEGMTGTFGDYAIYSFGYSKIVDLDNGGMIVSKRNLDGISHLNSGLEEYDCEAKYNLQFFSQLYRLMRECPESDLVKDIYKLLPKHLRKCFIYKSELHLEELARNSFNNLSHISNRRNILVQHYVQHLRENDIYSVYQFHSGAVPWRFNLLVNPKYKKALVKFLLSYKVPVSDWYPKVITMFGMNGEYPGVEKMESEILNFPLVNIDESQIVKICGHIERFCLNAND